MDFQDCNSGASPGRKQWCGQKARVGLIASAEGARAYNGGLGALGLGAEPPAGSRGRAPGQGVRGAKPP